MLSLTESQKAAIKSHSIMVYEYGQNEACGFVLQDGSVLSATNIAKDPTKNFLADPDTTEIAIRRGIAAIYHSHCDGRFGFSPEDGRQCKTQPYPWVLYHVPVNDFRIVDPSGDEPYLGREFCWWINDCYSLVRDFYRRELGVMLDDFDRPDFFGGEHQRYWQPEEWNVFEENFASQGFLRLSPDSPPQRGDVALLQIHGGKPNHLGLFHDNGESGTFWHQVFSRPSCADSWLSWQRHCIAILRSKEVMA